MDSLTQAILGASIGEAVIGKKVGKSAAIAGAIIGTVPDLDVLFLPLLGELERISFHRGFSHSILFCLLAALLIAFALSRSKRFSIISYRKLWTFSFLALFTHVLLDAFTTYGTQLLLPFSNWRVSFDSINIIDPVYTMPLGIGLFSSLYFYNQTDGRRSLPNNLGLIFSSIYLLFTLANKQHIQRVFYNQLMDKDLPSYGLLTVPVGVGNLNWYGVAKGKEHIYLGKYSWLDNNDIDFDAFPINDQLLDGLDEELVRTIKWIAQGYYTVAEHAGKIRVYNMQCDMQGVRTFGEYRAPTAFYYEIQQGTEGSYELSTGMHPKEGSQNSDESEKDQ